MSPEFEQQVRTALQPYDLQMVVVFGSIARGDAGPDSDLDVAVLAGHVLTVDQRIDITRALAAAFERPVDLIDLYHVGEPLLGRIASEGRLIVGSTDHWGRLIYRHLVNQADFVPLQNRILKTRRDAWIKPSSTRS